MVVLNNHLVLPPYFLITLIFVACSIPLGGNTVGFSMTEEQFMKNSRLRLHRVPERLRLGQELRSFGDGGWRAWRSMFPWVHSQFPLGIPPRKTQKKMSTLKRQVPFSTLGNLHLPTIDWNLEQVPMLVLGRVSWWDRKFLFDVKLGQYVS